MRTLLQISLVSVLLIGVLWAQVDRGTITGTVTDGSGAVLAGVQVVVTNTATGATYQSATNGLGIYSVVSLPIGSYSVSFSRDGFTTLNRPGLSLIAAQVLKLDAKMQVGSVKETVTVNAEPPLVDTQNSNLGTTLEAHDMTDLPLNVYGGRDASNILYSTTPTMSGGLYVDHIAGSGSFSKTVMIDGADANSGIQGFAFTPGMDAIQEMQAQVSGIGVEGAGTGGGVLMYELKSGTNKLHGSAFGFLHNEALDANTWDNKYWLSQCAQGDTACHNAYKRARNRLNDWGFSAGGPIWKNHTFIFGAYEKYSATDLRMNPAGATVPTAKMLTGDFSELLTQGAHQGPILDGSGNAIVNPCTGQAYQYGQIFNPATWRTVNGQTCANPYPGNIITSGLSGVSKQLVPVFQKYYAPTIAGRITGNFPSLISGAPWWNKTNLDLKLDHNFSDRNHLSASFNSMHSPVRARGDLFSPNGGGPFSSAWDQDNKQMAFRVNDAYSFSPSVLNSFSISMAQNFAHERPDQPTDPTAYGIPNPGSMNFPAISFGGANGIGITSLGTTLQDYYALNSYHISDTLSWVKGRHTLKFGGQFTIQQNNSNYGGNAQTYSFSNETGAPVDARITNLVGFGFANFMLGDVQSASQAVPNPSYDRRKLFDLFVQDDIKVTPKLTVNAGLRWDVNLPLHEKYGHWTNWDMSAQNPLWGSYKGAWTFAKNGSDSFEKYNDYKQFGPHIGASYQISNRLVARGAWGIFYVPLGMNQWFGQSNPGDQNWFFAGTNSVPNYVPGSTAFNWDGGYPGQTVTMPRTNTQTYVAGIWPIEIDPNNLHLGRTQNWNLGIEYELSKNIVLDVNYVGNIGRDLHDGNLKAYQNYPSWSAYQKLLKSDQAWASVSDPASAAAAGVAYPFPGFLGYAWEAISPIPQVAEFMGLVVNAGAPVGVSAYNALVVETKAKQSHGFTYDLSYTLSKATGSVAGSTNFWNAGATYWFQSMEDFQNAGKNVLSYDQRHTVKGYVNYDLPFGKGKKWANAGGTLDYIVGGWTLGFQPSYASGMPMGGVGSTLVYPGWMGLRANLNPGAHLGNNFKGLDLKNLSDPSNQFFSPANFVNPTYGELGNSPFIYNNWRGWASYNENLSVLKHFSFGSENQYRFTLRAEFYDVFNRHQWGGPDMYLGSPYFGQVTSVSGNRTGQFGGRFEW